jgi:hypothetical protein
MKNKEKIKEIIPIAKFKDAFLKLKKFKPEEVVYEEYIGGKSLKVTYKNEDYKIDTYDYLKEMLQEDLKDRDHATLVHLNLFLKASKPMLNNQKFFEEMIEVFGSKDEAEIFAMALTLSSFAPEKEKTFWYALQSLDRMGRLYGNAIIIAGKVQDFKAFVLSLLKLQIEYGIDVYNQMQQGTFDIVYSNESGSEDIIEFYIYSVDPT